MAISEIKKIKALIAEGVRLKGLPGFNNIYQTSEPSGLALPITSLVDGWSKKAVDLIYSICPIVIIKSDFSEFASIHDFYTSQKQVIQFNYKDNINVIIDTLKIYGCFIEWLNEHDDNDLNLEQKAIFNFEPLRAIFQYTHEMLVSSLLGLEDGRTEKTALLHLYGRIIQIIGSIIKLDNYNHCQLLIASLRTLLELYIDMLLIKECKIENAIEKFFSFNNIYKFVTAQKIIRLNKELQKPEESLGVKEYVQNSERFEQKAQELWSNEPKKIIHWSCLPLEERARRTNSLDYYRHVYYYANMFVHSGYVDLDHSEGTAHTMCAHVFGLSSEMFKNSTELICNKIKINQNEEIIAEVDKIWAIFGYFQLWKRHVEPEKFS